jgi:hypothetical protein
VQFHLHGRSDPFLDDGGHFVVHMFTHLGDKDAVHAECLAERRQGRH